MIYDNLEKVKEICSFLEDKTRYKGISIDATPIRDDIFEILRKECALLYYPLSDEKVKGCHAKRTVDGEFFQLVFIIPELARKSVHVVWSALMKT